MAPMGPLTSKMEQKLDPTLPCPPVLGPHESVLTVATGGATVETYISLKSTKQYGLGWKLAMPMEDIVIKTFSSLIQRPNMKQNNSIIPVLPGHCDNKSLIG